MFDPSIRRQAVPARRQSLANVVMEGCLLLLELRRHGVVVLSVVVLSVVVLSVVVLSVVVLHGVVVLSVVVLHVVLGCRSAAGCARAPNACKVC